MKDNNIKLQLALDMPDKNKAMEIAKRVCDYIDIFELGTVLCCEAGMQVVRDFRQQFPDHIILADIRIVKAGGNLANQAFGAGANWVSVISDSSEETIRAVADKCQEYPGTDFQIELNDGYNWSQVDYWKRIGVQQIIYHRLSEVSDSDTQEWSDEAINSVSRLCDEGFKVTITGGITIDNINVFKCIPVYVVIVGRSICNADDPVIAARHFKEALIQLSRG